MAHSGKLVSRKPRSISTPLCLQWPASSLERLWELAYFLTCSCKQTQALSCRCQYLVTCQVTLIFLYLYFRTRSIKEVGGISRIMQLWTTLSHGCQRFVLFSSLLHKGAVVRDLWKGGTSAWKCICFANSPFPITPSWLNDTYRPK